MMSFPGDFKGLESLPQTTDSTGGHAPIPVHTERCSLRVPDTVHRVHVCGGGAHNGVF